MQVPQQVLNDLVRVSEPYPHFFLLLKFYLLLIVSEMPRRNNFCMHKNMNIYF